MSSPRQRIASLHRFEPIVFLLLLAAHLSVLFRFEWYPTLDGPAHVYNAYLIKQMLLGNEFLSRYFEFSSFPEPNWSGHAIMAFLSLFLPANWVEKGLVLIIFAGTALTFRWLVLRLRGEQHLSSLLIFPFLGGFTLRTGFFNFSLSIALLLAVLAFWHTAGKRPRTRHYLSLCLLLGLLYFSHALTTLVCCGALLLLTLWWWRCAREEVAVLRDGMFPLLLAMSPWIVLILLFVLRADDVTAAEHLPVSKLLSIIADGVPFTLHYGPGMMWAARSIGLVILGGSLLLLPRQWRSLDPWLVMTLGSLAAYALLPDKAATGGLISVRYLQFFYLFLVLWMAARPEWPRALYLFLLPYLLADLFLVKVDHGFTRDRSADVEELMEALPAIESGSAVLPIVYSDYWFHSNCSNYLGTGPGILILDNYEAMAPHFPLRWRPEHRPPPADRTFYNSPRPCIDIGTLGRAMDIPLHHVVRWQYRPEMNDSCTMDLSRQLEQDFVKVHSGPYTEVFRRR